MRTNTPFVVLSAENPQWLADVNDWRTRSLEAQLRRDDLQFAPMEGNYNGHAEASFLVFCPGGDSGPAFTLVRKLAVRWGQESVLYVDANRMATLVYLDGRKSVELGMWHETGAGVAAKAGSFTYEPNAGRYFVTGSVTL